MDLDIIVPAEIIILPNLNTHVQLVPTQIIKTLHMLTSAPLALLEKRVLLERVAHRMLQWLVERVITAQKALHMQLSTHVRLVAIPIWPISRATVNVPFVHEDITALKARQHQQACVIQATGVLMVSLF